ncbi:branched-chain amino acid ABC transporter permease [Pseudooceanicola aestuarii]|uniref:branched-chain amino acid ABC transporter permease n=1 Tax=Pseudooceanicola aestuarii TaxID=2697319 RepID=UPI0013D1BCF8|nr:branched-chain amino acid ABC transporter permease [Pseudooceanicola aestuarii]
MPLDTILQVALDGISVGAIYALVGLGFVLTYKSAEVINFALGDLLMFACFVGWTLSVPLGLPLWLALILAIAATGLMGGLINHTVMERIVGQPQFAQVLLTIGISFVLRGGVFLIWGVDQRTLDSLVPDRSLGFLGLSIRTGHLQILVVTLALVAALYLFFRRTRAGLAMTAVAENQLAAYLMAIPVRRYISLVWVMSAAVAGAAGLMLAPMLLVDINLWTVVIKGLIVAVIGGFHSIPGALLGGLLIGQIEQFSGVFLDSELSELCVYATFFVLLALFPRGLMGAGQMKRV